MVWSSCLVHLENYLRFCSLDLFEFGEREKLEDKVDILSVFGFCNNYEKRGK